MRNVTLLVTGVPQFVTLVDLSYNLDLIFDTNEIGTFRIRDITSYKGKHRIGIALDFSSGYDAIAAQERLDGYRYTLPNGDEHTLRAKITRRKEIVRPNDEIQIPERPQSPVTEQDQKALALVPVVSAGYIERGHAALDAQLEFLKKQKLILQAERELLRERRKLKREYYKSKTNIDSEDEPTTSRWRRRSQSRDASLSSDTKSPRSRTPRTPSGSPPRAKLKELRSRSRSKEESKSKREKKSEITEKSKETSRHKGSKRRSRSRNARRRSPLLVRSRSRHSRTLRSPQCSRTRDRRRLYPRTRDGNDWSPKSRSCSGEPYSRQLAIPSPSQAAETVIVTRFNHHSNIEQQCSPERVDTTFDDVFCKSIDKDQHASKNTYTATTMTADIIVKPNTQTYGDENDGPDFAHDGIWSDFIRQDKKEVEKLEALDDTQVAEESEHANKKIIKQEMSNKKIIKREMSIAEIMLTVNEQIMFLMHKLLIEIKTKEKMNLSINNENIIDDKLRSIVNNRIKALVAHENMSNSKAIINKYMELYSDEDRLLVKMILHDITSGTSKDTHTVWCSDPIGTKFKEDPSTELVGDSINNTVSTEMVEVSEDEASKVIEVIDILPRRPKFVIVIKKLMKEMQDSIRKAKHMKMSFQCKFKYILRILLTEIVKGKDRMRKAEILELFRQKYPKEQDDEFVKRVVVDIDAGKYGDLGRSDDEQPSEGHVDNDFILIENKYDTIIISDSDDELEVPQKSNVVKEPIETDAKATDQQSDSLHLKRQSRREDWAAWAAARGLAPRPVAPGGLKGLAPKVTLFPPRTAQLSGQPAEPVDFDFITRNQNTINHSKCDFKVLNDSVNEHNNTMSVAACSKEINDWVDIKNNDEMKVKTESNDVVPEFTDGEVENLLNGIGNVGNADRTEERETPQVTAITIMTSYSELYSLRHGTNEYTHKEPEIKNEYDALTEEYIQDDAQYYNPYQESNNLKNTSNEMHNDNDYRKKYVPSVENSRKGFDIDIEKKSSNTVNKKKLKLSSEITNLPVTAPLENLQKTPESTQYSVTTASTVVKSRIKLNYDTGLKEKTNLATHNTKQINTTITAILKSNTELNSWAHAEELNVCLGNKNNTERVKTATVKSETKNNFVSNLKILNGGVDKHNNTEQVKTTKLTTLNPGAICSKEINDCIDIQNTNEVVNNNEMEVKTESNDVVPEFTDGEVENLLNGIGNVDNADRTEERETPQVTAITIMTSYSELYSLRHGTNECTHKEAEIKNEYDALTEEYDAQYYNPYLETNNNKNTSNEMHNYNNYRKSYGPSVENSRKSFDIDIEKKSPNTVNEKKLKLSREVTNLPVTGLLENLLKTPEFTQYSVTTASTVVKSTEPNYDASLNEKTELATHNTKRISTVNEKELNIQAAINLPHINANKNEEETIASITKYVETFCTDLL